MDSDDGVSPGRPSHGDRFGVTIAVIALLGLILRVAYVVWARGDPIGPDAQTYHLQALALADGHGLVDMQTQRLFDLAKAPPDASQPPGWPFLLSVAARAGLRSVLSQQLVACVVGTATIVMTGLAGRAAMGRRTALIAAGLVAVYPNVWLYERELMSEPLALFGVATCIWLTYRFLAKPGLRLAFALGAIVGLLALTRVEEIALLGLLVVPVIMAARGVVRRRRAVCLALAVIACVLIVGPWIVYNTRRFDHPVFISTGFGETLNAGNCAPTYSGNLLGYYTSGFLTTCLRPPNLSSNAAVADGQLRRFAISFMRDHEARVPVVVAARIGRVFNFFRPFQQVHLETERGTPLWVLRLGLFTYWVFLPTAIAGVILARRRRVPLFPLLAFLVVVLLAVAVTIGDVRYRAVAEIPLVLLAAYAINIVTDRAPGRVADRPWPEPDPSELRELW